MFSKLLWTRVLLFLLFGGLMALIVGVNLYLAFRLRPMFRPHSPEQANLERYREVITPMRRLLLLGVSVVFGIFAGVSATGKWRIFLLWNNREDFGKADPYFHKDLSFYIFSLPWLHFLVDFLMTAVFTALLLAAVVHYLYGGIRLQSATDKVSGAAQAQLSALFGVFLLLKGFDYWLDRFDLTSQAGGLVTGMTYTRDNAVLPSKNILMFIAIICAFLFFANILRRTWLLPGVGLALFAIAAVLLGGVWPGLMQRFQVKPDEPDKEAPYIQKNIQATRSAFGLEDTTVTEYNAQTKLSQAQLQHRRRFSSRHPPRRPPAGLGHLRAAAAGARLLQRPVRCSTSTATRSGQGAGRRHRCPRDEPRGPAGRPEEVGQREDRLHPRLRRDRGVRQPARRRGPAREQRRRAGLGRGGPAPARLADQRRPGRGRLPAADLLR